MYQPTLSQLHLVVEAIVAERRAEAERLARASGLRRRPRILTVLSRPRLERVIPLPGRTRPPQEAA